MDLWEVYSILVVGPLITFIRSVLRSLTWVCFVSKWVRNGAHASWQHPPSDAKNPRQHVFLSKIYNEHGSGKMNDIVSVLRGGPVGLLSRWPSADKRLCFLALWLYWRRNLLYHLHDILLSICLHNSKSIVFLTSSIFVDICLNRGLHHRRLPNEHYPPHPPPLPAAAAAEEEQESLHALAPSSLEPAWLHLQRNSLSFKRCERGICKCWRSNGSWRRGLQLWRNTIKHRKVLCENLMKYEMLYQDTAESGQLWGYWSEWRTGWGVA